MKWITNIVAAIVLLAAIQGFIDGFVWVWRKIYPLTPRYSVAIVQEFDGTKSTMNINRYTMDKHYINLFGSNVWRRVEARRVDLYEYVKEK